APQGPMVVGVLDHQLRVQPAHLVDDAFVQGVLEAHRYRYLVPGGAQRLRETVEMQLVSGRHRLDRDRKRRRIEVAGGIERGGEVADMQLEARTGGARDSRGLGN